MRASSPFVKVTRELGRPHPPACYPRAVCRKLQFARTAGEGRTLPAGRNVFSHEGLPRRSAVVSLGTITANHITLPEGQPFNSPVRGARVRQLIHRFRACEAGAGLVEYGLLLAMGALALIAALQLYTSAVAGLTSRATFSISKQSAGGYAPGPNSSSGGTAGRPSPGSSDDPESPDSASAGDDPACPESGHGPCKMAGRSMSY